MAYDPPGFFNRLNSLLSKYPRLSSMLGGSDSGTGGSSVGYPDSSLIYGTGQPLYTAQQPQLYAMDPGQTQGQPLTVTEGVQGGGGTLSKAPNLLSKGGGLLGKVNPYIAAGTAALGGIQTIAGLIGMSRLNKEKWPEFTQTEELKKSVSDATQRAKFGYSPEQMTSAKYNINLAQNLAQQNALNMSGGNLATAISGMRAGSGIRAYNDLAAADASMNLNNIRYRDSVYDKVQSLENMKTQAALQRRMALEQAYGGAIRSGSNNIAGVFNLASALRYNPAA